MHHGHKEIRSVRSAHTFHIPVMGTGFTIDTPLRLTKYGISLVISLGDDVLIEQMRRFHCERTGEPYEEISNDDEDARARRITAYLNLIDRLVHRQVETLQASPFEPGSEITRYYELLPETPLKDAYRDMLATGEAQEKTRKQNKLRQLAVPGSIDVNIMAKVDRDVFRDGKKLPPRFGIAMAALRGYANSTLRSSIVFSAGMNARLYGYAAEFEDFFPNEERELQKRIVLKVSDYRSALIQGKFLAKRGLWISEFRIESGLNCGGHAFATKGHLMGPILEEFKQNRQELADTLHALYAKALADAGRGAPPTPYQARISVQGGIGTAAENDLLFDSYDIDGTGWATPFLLVREVANVDDEHIKRLLAATDREVCLSDCSPLGVPFWSLLTSASEQVRRQRIREGNPGSPCPKGYLSVNTEFTTAPVCTASQVYQSHKLEHLSLEGHSKEQLAVAQEAVLAKACICNDLAGGVVRRYGIDPEATPSVCCGPNIVNFSKTASLEEMVGHIYGRLSLLTNPDRPHMFITELRLYVKHLREQLRGGSQAQPPRPPKYFREFRDNLLDGIRYYHRLAEGFVHEQKGNFVNQLNAMLAELEALKLVATASLSGA